MTVAKFKKPRTLEEILPRLNFLGSDGFHYPMQIRFDVSKRVAALGLKDVMIEIGAANLLFGERFYLDVSKNKKRCWLVIE